MGDIQHGTWFVGIPPWTCPPLEVSRSLASTHPRPQARLITDRDLQLLRRYDHRGAYGAYDLTSTASTASTSSSLSRWGLLTSTEGYRYVQAMLSVLKNVTKDETVQYVLAMLDDIVENMMMMMGPGLVSGEPSWRTRLELMRRLLFPELLEAGGEVILEPYGVLTKLLGRDDWYTKEKAARLLSVALACDADGSFRDRGVVNLLDAEEPATPTSATNATDMAQKQLIEWCVHQLRKPSHPQCAVPAALHCLSAVLKESEARRVVYTSGGVQAIAGLFAGGVGRTRSGAGGIGASVASLSVQAQYELALCVWLLSLFPPALEVLATPTVMRALVEYVRLAHKEKVVRVALLALKSLLGSSSDGHGRHHGHHTTIALEMSAVESGLPKAIEHRRNQEWDDPDIVALLEYLQDRLDAGVLAMSSMERYKKEIAEGVLVPGPMHDSEAFWLENAERLMDNNSAVLKGLLGLLDPSHDATTLRLACRGVSNFVQFFPHGKGVVSDLDGKTLVMRLMAHNDSSVQREALLCVQRLLLSKGNLSYLSSSAL